MPRKIRTEDHVVPEEPYSQVQTMVNYIVAFFIEIDCSLIQLFKTVWTATPPTGWWSIENINSIQALCV